MQDTELFLPVHYGTGWFIVGAAMIFAVFAGVAAVFWITRKKKLPTVSTLAPKEVSPRNLDVLKKKYLKMLDEVEQGYRDKKYTARIVHQFCSQTLRLFVYEACGFPAQVMTLSDLKLSRYSQISDLIAAYYPPEFARAESTTIDDAVSSARRAIESWV